MVKIPERLSLTELRARFGVTQDRLGAEMDTSQPGVKKLEGAADPRLSSLRRFVLGLGRATDRDAALEVRAIVDGEAFTIDISPKETLSPKASGARGSHHSAAWRLRAWDDPAAERVWLARSIIAISSDEIGDVSREPSMAEYRSRLRAAPALAGRSTQAIGQFAGYWQMFRSAMQKGDIVAVPMSGRRVAIGEITGPYTYLADETEPRLRHVRSVHWLARDLNRQELDEDLKRVINAPGTICSFRAPQATERLRIAAE